MTDYTELKRLAEAAQEDPNSPYLPCPVAFMNAATPSVVLALIAENERIKARLCVCRDCGGQGEVYSGHSSYQGHNQPPEPDMDVCGTCGGDGVLGPLEDFESLAAERDQLKAEVDSLTREADRQYTTIEAYRKNADRYVWLREARSGYIEVVEWIGPHATGMTGEDLDALLDAAMGKGEQS